MPVFLINFCIMLINAAWILLPATAVYLIWTLFRSAAKHLLSGYFKSKWNIAVLVIFLVSAVGMTAFYLPTQPFLSHDISLEGQLLMIGRGSLPREEIKLTGMQANQLEHLLSGYRCRRSVAQTGSIAFSAESPEQREPVFFTLSVWDAQNNLRDYIFAPKTEIRRYSGFTCTALDPQQKIYRTFKELFPDTGAIPSPEPPPLPSAPESSSTPAPSAESSSEIISSAPVSSAPQSIPEPEVSKRTAQKAYKLWKTFGGSPRFTDLESVTALIAGDLYANHRDSQHLPIEFTTEDKDGLKWMSAAPVEEFMLTSFNVKPEQLHDSSGGYDTDKGYLYPLVFSAAPAETELLSLKQLGDGQAVLRIAYTFDLPIGLPANEKAISAIHTVVIAAKEDTFFFVSAEIE